MGSTTRRPHIGANGVVGATAGAKTKVIALLLATTAAAGGGYVVGRTAPEQARDFLPTSTVAANTLDRGIAFLFHPAPR